MYVRKLPSGRWQCTVRHPSGRKVTKTDRLKAVVVAWGNATEAEFKSGSVPLARLRRLTVADWHAKWLAARMVEASTARKDDASWRNHIEPAWGTWPLDAITRLDVQKWVRSMDTRGVGPDAIRTAYGLLSAMLNGAVDHDLIVSSPCRRVTLPRAPKPEPRWLTRLEYDRLQLALGAATVVRGGRSRIPDPQAGEWQALVALGCYSGLRPGELAGLDVEQVDLERRLVKVGQVLTRVPDGVGGHRFDVRPYPKSSSSERYVPFPQAVADLLWPLVADRTTGPLFQAPRGGRLMVESNWARQVWRPALERAGIEPVRPYVMRHTMASWAVQAGISDRRIMQMLGHADRHLIEVYAHLDPREHDEIRAAWGESAFRAGAEMAHGDRAPGEIVA